MITQSYENNFTSISGCLVAYHLSIKVKNLSIHFKINWFYDFFYDFFYFLFYSSAFLRGLLPCVRTKNLANVRYTREGARTVRDLGPIYSDSWDPFATVELRLLSIRCRRLLIPILFSNVEHYILHEQIFFNFTLKKFGSVVGSRTRVLSFRSPNLMICPRVIIWPILIIFRWFFWVDYIAQDQWMVYSCRYLPYP